MEIPGKVLDTLLNQMANSDLYNEDDLPDELPNAPNTSLPKEVETKNKPVRRFKSNPTIVNTATILFSQEGKYRALVQTVFDSESDKNCYRVNTTGRTFTSHRLAINHARRWLKKKRTKFYRKHPEKKPRVKTVRLNPKKKDKSPISKINKLYKMESKAAKILVRMSNKKLKIHKDYSRKKFSGKKTTAVSGDTKDFNVAIFNVMKDGTKKERKLVANMLKKFTHEPYRSTNMFY